MRYAVLSILLISLLIVMVGCGGSDPNTTVIALEDNGFQPNSKTINANSSITWSNADNSTHSVVSGVLEPTAFPVTINIQILNNSYALNNGAIITTLKINFGDTLVFKNVTTQPRQVEIKDQNLNAVFISPTLALNDTASFDTHSASAGFFTIRDSLGFIPTTPLSMTGVPVPDGLFNSGILTPAQQFQFTFPNPGTFTYFDGVSNIATGTIIVQ